MALGCVRTESGKATSGSGSKGVVDDVQVAAVPSFFLCPISLELMRDPVTLSTGMTYDRVSIEKWLGIGHNRCPTTNQVLERSAELIPNHTLRRLIQNWCVANRVERIPTPRSPVGVAETVNRLLRSVSGQCEAEAEDEGMAPVSKLRRLASECERHRQCIADAGGVVVLAAALPDMELDRAMDALGVIALLPLQEPDKKALSNPATLSSLTAFLPHPAVTSDAKVHAAEVLHALADQDARVKVAVGESAIPALVTLLKDERVVQAALRCLLSLTLPRRNRVVAIDARAIPALVTLLPATEKRNKELAFALLEILANCAEGREAITNNAAAIPMIVKSMLGVSHRATEHAVAALWVVLSYASNRSVINTALHAGAFTNLLMLLPSECSQRAKLKARDCLKLLNEVWGSYTCRAVDESSPVVGARFTNHKRHLGHQRFSAEFV